MWIEKQQNIATHLKKYILKYQQCAFKKSGPQLFKMLAVMPTEEPEQKTEH